MSDPLAKLDYASPNVRVGQDFAFLMPSLAILVFNSVAAIVTCRLVSKAAAIHNGSFSGCATGRLHGDDLLFFALLPACTLGLSKYIAMMDAPRLETFARLGMVTAMAAYGVLWLNFVGFVNFLHFEVFHMP